MGLGVHALEAVSSDAGLDEARELTLEGILVLLLQGLHVVGNVLSEDVLTVDFSIEFLGLTIETWESLAAG